MEIQKFSVKYEYVYSFNKEAHWFAEVHDGDTGLFVGSMTALTKQGIRRKARKFIRMYKRKMRINDSRQPFTEVIDG